MLNNNQPRFDGVKWRCPKCQSVLATVAEVEELQLSTMESKRVAVLELPAGYVKPNGREEFVKPQKAQPFQRGAGNQKQRIKRRKFTERQLEVAQEKSDIASIFEAQRKLAQFEALASKASEPTTETTATRLRREELPVSIKCAKPGCSHVARIASIRARPNVAQRGGV